MTTASANVRTKRAYDEPASDDGRRVLVDRLWPRGLSKERAHVDLWLRAVAPSEDLRKWYGHDPAKWDEFRRRYRDELRAGEAAAALVQLRDLAREGPLTLVYAARDGAHANATVLAELLAAGAH